MKKKAKYEEALVAYCGQLTRGTHDASLAKQRLNLKGGTWTRIAAKLKDPSSRLSQQLTAMNVAYFVTGDHGQQRAVLVRA